MDTKLILFIIAGAFTGLYMAYDAGLFKAIRLPSWGSVTKSKADSSAAIEHARQLAEHLHKLGMTTEANQVAEAAAKIVRASMTYSVVIGTQTTA